MMSADFFAITGKERFVGSFGERLRREREMRGISLDEIATATKISARNLRALEDEKFKQLPGGIFNKGFVRAYAKFLGIDEDQMVAEYVAASQDIESAREQKLRNDLSKVEFKRDDDEREISLEPKSQWGTIAIIVLIAAAVFGGYEFYQKKKAERQQAQTPPVVTNPATTAPAPVVQTPVSTAVTNGLVATNSTAPVTTGTMTATPGSNSSAGNAGGSNAGVGAKPGTTGTGPATSAAGTPATAATAVAGTQTASQKSTDVAATKPNQNPKPSQTGKTDSTTAVNPGGPIDVKIHANQDSWVSITADGKTIMKGTLPAASEKAVRAKDQVVVVLGNAGGVEVSYNGKTLDNLGKGQEVKKITFTPSGYQ